MLCGCFVGVTTLSSKAYEAHYEEMYKKIGESYQDYKNTGDILKLNELIEVVDDEE